MKVRLLSIAWRDLAGAQDFYERQSPGLGDYFLSSLFSDIDSLVLYHGIHRRFRGFHRLLSKRFPYAIYYKVNGRVIEVWRVLDCRQNPRRTFQALTEID